MSIEDAREKLQSAKADLVQGGGHAERGRDEADEAFTKFAEAEGHRHELLDQARELRLLVQRAGQALQEFSVQAYKAATLQEGLDETSRAASNSFARAEGYGISARGTLTDVLGAEDAAAYGPCVYFSNMAAVHALNTATRADAAEHQLFEVANRLKALARDLGHITDEVFTATSKIPLAGTSQDEVAAMLARASAGEVTGPFDALRGQVANDPAAALENGHAATGAFDTAIQSVDERLGRL